jgi:uncharacterized protein YdaU (DUF1376 family)
MSQFDHWMRFNVGDYLADTMHLTTFQHGIYVLLIMHYFKHGGLPNDDAALRRIAKVPNVLLWRNESGPVLAMFKAHGDALRHSRIDAERERARAISEVKSAAGRVGASSRWHAENHMPGRIKKHAPRDSYSEPSNPLEYNDMFVAPAKHVDGMCDPARWRARATPEPELETSAPVAPQVGRRADGTNPRDLGSNQRAAGFNPRALGTNPRANGTNQRQPTTRIVLDMIREEIEEEASHAETRARQANPTVAAVAGNPNHRDDEP